MYVFFVNIIYVYDSLLNPNYIVLDIINLKHVAQDCLPPCPHSCKII